jgi:tetratricopeptide (TPR) repeat protein
MPARSIVHICAHSAEIRTDLAEMRSSYAKRGINISWISPSSEVDYRASYKKALAACDGALFILSHTYGLACPEGDGASYLEYALTQAAKRPIPIGFILLDKKFPLQADAPNESAEQKQRQLDFRKSCKQTGKFVRSASTPEELKFMSSDFREYLNGPAIAVPWKLIIGSAAAIIVGVGLFQLRTSMVKPAVEVAEYTPEQLAAIAFPDGQKPVSVDIPEAAPLPPELANTRKTDGSRLSSTVKDVAPEIVAKHDANLGKVENLVAQGEILYAKRTLNQIIPDMLKEMGEFHPSTIRARVVAGHVAHADGYPANAIQVYENALTDAEKHFETNHPLTREILFKLGAIYMEERDFTKAEARYRRLSKLLQSLPAEKHGTEQSVVRFSLAHSLLEQGNKKQARPLFEQAAKDAEANFGKYHQQTQMIAQFLKRCEE